MRFCFDKCPQATAAQISSGDFSRDKGNVIVLSAETVVLAHVCVVVFCLREAARGRVLGSLYLKTRWLYGSVTRATSWSGLAVRRVSCSCARRHSYAEPCAVSNTVSDGCNSQLRALVGDSFAVPLSRLTLHPNKSVVIGVWRVSLGFVMMMVATGHAQPCGKYRARDFGISSLSPATCWRRVSLCALTQQTQVTLLLRYVW